MTREQIVGVITEAVEELRQAIYIPWDTGNMATNALRYRQEGNLFIIYLDESIAPYVPYTIEPWTSPKWNGKQNPNEGWWEDWCKLLANRVAAKLRGTIKT